MAIAFDATSSGASNSATSYTYTHTCTGANLYLLVFVWTNQASVTGITYNSVAMTKLKESETITNSRHIYVFGLANPATGGAYDVTISISSLGQIYSGCMSYTGCASTQPDADGTGTVSNQASITGTVTAVENNCWLAMGVVSGADDNLGNGSAGANTTWRNAQSNLGVYDSNAARASGSNSLVATLTGSQTDDMAQVVLSLTPYGITKSVEGGYFHFM